MNPDDTTQVRIVPGLDDLLLIEMRIAQRADELRMNCGCPVGTDLVHWMQAEREIFDGYIGLAEPAASLSGRN